MNQQVRFRDFTRRQVRDREQLFSPETTDWPTDEDHSANWDYMIEILIWFGTATALGCVLLTGWLAWLLIAF